MQESAIGRTRKASVPGAVWRKGPETEADNPFTGWKGMLFQDPAGSRSSSAKQDTLACGRGLQMPDGVAKGSHRDCQ